MSHNTDIPHSDAELPHVIPAWEFERARVAQQQMPLVNPHTTIGYEHVYSGAQPPAKRRVMGRRRRHVEGQIN
jgi:hypothetical protein